MPNADPVRGGVEIRPVLLDLFCCQGGAAMGYHRAGFNVIGVDQLPQRNYPFEFHLADALRVLDVYLEDPARTIWKVDAIHASPPCQGYLNLTRVNEALGRNHEHENLIGAVRERLEAIGLPYVIENVPDAKRHMRDPVRVCGTSFDLPLRRHRLFESNIPLQGTTCAHHRFTEQRYWTGWRPKGEKRLSTVVQVYGNAADKHEWPAAMGIDWMDYDGLAEAIPPVYTEHVGRQLMAAITMEAAA